MGHYCRVCGRTRSNESFSGKGHRQHICRMCQRKSKAKRRGIQRLPLPRLSLLDLPFKQLIEHDRELQSLRREFTAKSEKERRQAAQSLYDGAYAADLFNVMLASAPNTEDSPLPGDEGPCPGAVAALAIEPKFGPALLTVGTVEYRLGRHEEAMELFLILPTLPADTEDLSEIIEQAAYFLADETDYDRARQVFQSAVDHFPTIGLYYNGLAYCAGKLGQRERAVELCREAVGRDPKNHRFLSDLGYCLMQVGRYAEAEPILIEAVARSPRGDTVARNNLRELHRLMKRPDDMPRRRKH